MKKYLKVTSYLLFAAFFSVILTGCGSKVQIDPSANKIVVWSFEDSDIWKPIVESFASTYKGYSLVYQKQTLDSNYENKVLNSILSGQGPDVWAMPNDWVYRHKEKLAPMSDSMLKKYPVKDTFVQSVLESTIFDNKVYALSPSAQPLTLYYNNNLIGHREDELLDRAIDDQQKEKIRNLLSDIPQTWTDFTEASKLLTVKDAANNIQISGIAMGTSKISNAEDILYLLMKQNETDILSADMKTANFNLPKATGTGSNDAPGKRAMEFYTSFADPSSPNYSWNDNLGSVIDAFANGKVAYMLGYSSLQKTLLDKYPEASYQRTYVPQLTTDKDKIVDFATFNAFGVNKLSKNVSAAWGAIKLLVDENSDSFSAANSTYTSQKASSYDISFQERQGSSPDKLSLATAHSQVKGRYPEEFDTIFRQSISAINNKTQSLQSAIDFAANAVTENLRKDSW